MRVLAINSGSSSLRWGFFGLPAEEPLRAGEWQGVEDPAAVWLEAHEVLSGLRPDAVGHRVVHGGARFMQATRIDEAVLHAIESQVPLAPAHNPRALLGIREALKIFPDIPHVAVFDTAFHQSLAPEAFLYALPWEFFERDGIRRYGFHGTSHRFASERVAERLGRTSGSFRVITCHLGNGCSIAAVRNGRSVDTSMGMTPLEGLMMGTRSGDVDPAVVLDLAARPELGPERVKALLNDRSGLLGVSGVSSDLREVEAAAAAGHERATLALALFAHRVRRGIGAALGVLGGTDAVVFTGGIGEHGAAMRERILGGLSDLGMELDVEANRDCRGGEARISLPHSAIALYVIPAHEEWLIARETEGCLP
ncbi:MAG TPA: acetate kinase [Deltaproteobacteria bacterium]|nr:acetate kinase [Deltaproteobacteria bacterium]